MKEVTVLDVSQDKCTFNLPGRFMDDLSLTKPPLLKALWRFTVLKKKIGQVGLSFWHISCSDLVLTNETHILKVLA